MTVELRLASLIRVYLTPPAGQSSLGELKFVRVVGLLEPAYAEGSKEVREDLRVEFFRMRT